MWQRYKRISSMDSEIKNTYQHINCVPLAGALGAEVQGIQLSGDLTEEQLTELNNALLEYKVLFFRDQNMDEQGQADFASLVGTPVDADFIPAIEGFPMMTRQQYDENSRMGSDVNFHHDDSFHKYPTKMSILRAVTVPQYGGDTVWVDMEKVYESLSPAMQEFLEGKTCEHSLSKGFGRSMLEESSGESYDKMILRNPPHTHPLVIRHPVTGKKALYVGELLTLKINEISREESDLLLDYLCQLAYRLEFSCRFHWEDNSIAWWDNRNTVHRGVDDFYPELRVMTRVAIADEQQPSLNPDEAPKREIAHLDIVPCNSLDDDPEKTAGESLDDGVDEAFLAILNRKKEGITFTPAASIRVKSIPVMFRGAALSAIFETADQKGVTVIDDAILDIVQASR
jgi:taurine dioxygenase